MCKDRERGSVCVVWEKEEMRRTEEKKMVGKWKKNKNKNGEEKKNKGRRRRREGWMQRREMGLNVEKQTAS